MSVFNIWTIKQIILFLTLSTNCADEQKEFVGCLPAQEDCKLIACGHNDTRLAVWIPSQKTYTNYACCAGALAPIMHNASASVMDMRESVCQRGHIVKVSTQQEFLKVTLLLAHKNINWVWDV